MSKIQPPEAGNRFTCRFFLFLKRSREFLCRIFERGFDPFAEFLARTFEPRLGSFVEHLLSDSNTRDYCRRMRVFLSHSCKYKWYSISPHVPKANTGVEFSLQAHDRVFEKFYHIPNNDPWKHGITGLGWALAKRQVTHFGSTITVSSGSSQTTFTVML